MMNEPVSENTVSDLLEGFLAQQPSGDSRDLARFCYEKGRNDVSGTVFVLSVGTDRPSPGEGCACRLISVTGDPDRAHRLLVEEVAKYIDSWHQGDGDELYSRNEYFERGFVSSAPASRPDGPSEVEKWVLDEDDTYVEYLVTRLTLV